MEKLDEFLEQKGIIIPDIEFCKELYNNIKNSIVIAEGGIHTFEELNRILNIGINHVIIGGAITRPQNITRDYVNVYEQNPVFLKK
jgi:N-acylglucosamine-6-phosphate 2-epimerase